MCNSSCCWYHKGTNFQANHNKISNAYRMMQLLLIPQRYEFSSKSQHLTIQGMGLDSCCWYHKGTNFQANHNITMRLLDGALVVADTTKVRIFKQITTVDYKLIMLEKLLLIPQRYEFSSKSQQNAVWQTKARSCCWYHKGTNFQANHNKLLQKLSQLMVVADTTKVRIFKQITTSINRALSETSLLLIPQRYEFSSKSQPMFGNIPKPTRCCWYHKGTNFQANHNRWGSTR